MKTIKSYVLGIIAVSTALCACTSGKMEQTGNENSQEVAVAQPVKPDTKWMPDSVTILDSGLGIIIQNPGDSTRADINTPVTVHYKGMLAKNGAVFDSSYDRNEPATFRPLEVVPGFGEGIRQIGKGGKAILYIPSALGYGPQGAGGAIGPNENLIFEIEILNIGE